MIWLAWRHKMNKPWERHILVCTSGNLTNTLMMKWCSTQAQGSAGPVHNWLQLLVDWWRRNFAWTIGHTLEPQFLNWLLDKKWNACIAWFNAWPWWLTVNHKDHITKDLGRSRRLLHWIDCSFDGVACARLTGACCDQRQISNDRLMIIREDHYNWTIAKSQSAMYVGRNPWEKCEWEELNLMHQVNPGSPSSLSKHRSARMIGLNVVLLSVLEYLQARHELTDLCKYYARSVIAMWRER
jgi:hypothetical protein